MVFLSKLLGLGREMVIADKFGTSTEYDLYLIAIILPALAYGVINFASFYLFVPYLTRRFEAQVDGEPRQGWRSAWTIFNFSIVSAVVITVIIVLAAPYIMRIWTSDFTAEEFTRIILYSRLTALIVILGTSEAFFRAVLNIKQVFTYPAAGPIIFNLVSVACIILFYRELSVGAIAVGLVAGIFLQNIYLVIRLITYHPLTEYRPTVFSSEVKLVLVTAGVLILIEVLNRSYFMIDRYFAPAFGPGIVSALNYSQVLVQLPDSVVGLAIASVVFPMFSSSQIETDRERFGSVYRKAVTGGVLVAVPLAVYFFLNATDIVYLVFFRGVFNAESVHFTTGVLKPYTPTIIALFVVSTSIRACYGRGWGKTVLLFTVILLGAKFVATALFSRWFGYPGISAATTLSQVSFAIALLVLVIQRARMPEKGQFVFSVFKLLLAGAAGFLVLYFLGPVIAEYFPAVSRLQAVIRLIISGIVLFVVYLILVYWMGLGTYISRTIRISPRPAEERTHHVQ